MSGGDAPRPLVEALIGAARRAISARQAELLGQISAEALRESGLLSRIPRHLIAEEVIRWVLTSGDLGAEGVPELVELLRALGRGEDVAARLSAVGLVDVS